VPEWRKFFVPNLKSLGDKILRSKVSVRYRTKYPKAFQFISKRLSLKKFTGLPLTALFIALLANLMLLARISSAVVNSKEIIAVDKFVAKFLYESRSETAAMFLYHVTKLCDFPVVLLGGIALIIYFTIRKKYHFIFGVIISVCGSSITSRLGKSIFEIGRPHEFAYYYEDYFSFPSGHATTSVAFYGFMFYLLARNNLYFKSWLLIIIAAVLFFLLIGFSRLYLVVHYVSDVLAGYVLGFFWLFLSISITEWREHKLAGGLTQPAAGK
jgi:membrane-associated phospholipid phosphatase